MTAKNLIGAYIFGSVGRGQSDKLSDLDVLAVVRNGGGRIPENVISCLIPVHLNHMKISISWYGAKRIIEMYSNGELFSWHLNMETIPIYDPYSFLKNLGRPNPYTDASCDVASFHKILSGIQNQVMENSGNSIYEAGLIYICMRNIAMAASWVLLSAPDFSRYSPFNLNTTIACPISVKEYECAMMCRMAGQRGQDPPSGVDYTFVLSLYERLEPWVAHLRSVLERRI